MIIDVQTHRRVRFIIILILFLFLKVCFQFCYERDLIKSLSRKNQTEIILAFNSTLKYLDDVSNIDNIYFDQMVDRIEHTELQLNKANSSDTEAPFLDLNLSISNGTVSTKIYDKRDDFDFDIVNFPYFITKTRLFKYTENFTTKKEKIFDKKF